MKRTVALAAVMVILVLVSNSQAGVGLVMNGSFEQDGSIDITAQAPRHWCDVNIPSDKFGAKIDTSWATHGYDGGYSLKLYSRSGRTFAAGDMATVSQQVSLADARDIIFDIKLNGTHSLFPWDPNYFSAVVRIDDRDVWDSNDRVTPGNTEYYDAIVILNGISANDSNLHTLSLAMRANKSETHGFQYEVRWDFIKFDAHCGGFGYLPEDLNHDCYVDMGDLRIVTERWLREGPTAEGFDLFQDTNDIVDWRDFAMFASCWQDYVRHRSACRACDFDRSGRVDIHDLRMFGDNWLRWTAWLPDLNEDQAVDFKDVAILANAWLNNTYWVNWPADNCFEMERPSADLNDDGIVDLRDFAALTADWMNTGGCLRADFDRSGSVDSKDLSQLIDQWLVKSWIYDLD